MEDLSKSLLDEIELLKKSQDDANTELVTLRKKLEDVHRENQTLNAELGKLKLGAGPPEALRMTSDVGTSAKGDSPFEREV